jgi:hypothetical protein
MLASQAPTRQKFFQDLKNSRPFEDWCESLLQAAGWTTKRSKGATYDIQATRGHQTRYIECKFQPKSLLTGNYFIENKSLLDTQSDYLATGVIGDAYLIPMTTAKMLFCNFRKRQGGDTLNNFGALIPKHIFEQNNFYHLG